MTAFQIAMSQESAVVLAVGIVAAVIATVVLFWYFSAEQVARRALGAVRPSTLAELADGEIGKVVGTVALVGEPLDAPLSHRPCAHYEVRIEQYRSSGKSGSWHTMLHEVRSIDFLLQEGSNVARVEMTRARVVEVMDLNLRSGTFNDADPELEAFLASRGETSKGWIFNKKMRYTEGVLEPGESVAVLGLVGSETGRGHRVLRAPPDGELIVSDDPRTAD